MTVVLESKIDRVVVHARGAIVSRLVEVNLNVPTGPLDIVVENLPTQADPGSFKASVVGPNWKLSSLRSKLCVPTRPRIQGTVAIELNQVTEDLRKLQTQLEALKQRRAQLLSMNLQASLAIRSYAGKGEDRVSDSLAVTKLVREWLTDLDKRISTLNYEIHDQEKKKNEAICADGQSSSAERLGEGHASRSVNLRLEGSGAIHSIRLEYVIKAARWWPLYTIRLNPARDKATWSQQALVSQLSGEDWRGVSLSLSTADLVSDARLPELPSLRLGRVQTKKSLGYRAPPSDLSKMFAAYDSAFAAPQSKSKAQSSSASYAGAAMLNAEEILADLEDEEETTANFGRPVPPSPPPMMMPAPMSRLSLGAMPAASCPPPAPGFAPQADMRARSKKASFASMGGEQSKERMPRSGSFGGSGSEEPAPAEPEIEPSDAWLDFDSLRLGDLSDLNHRGRLRRETDAATLRAQQTAESAIASVVPTQKVKDPLSSRGLFDYAYSAQGLIDVPSDARAHRVGVCEMDASAELRYRTIPREEPEVYRELIVRNPFPWPLLDGPAEVYSEGSLVASTEVERLDRGGNTRIGLNVEDRVRVARNLRAEEETAGLLGGTTLVNHSVSIEISSSLNSPIELDLIDRLPETDDKDVEIKLLSCSPQSYKYSQADRGAPIRGGLGWTLKIPNSGKALVEYKYRISFSSKSELVGGNRRE